MKKIIDYQIVSIAGGLSGKKLENSILRNIELGWQPLGGICTDGDSRFYQAMVIYEEANEVFSEAKKEEIVKEHRQWQGAAIA